MSGPREPRKPPWRALTRRRSSVALCVVVAALAGCRTDAEPAAARLEDWALTEAQLADLLVLAQPFPLEAGAARDLARHWVAAGALVRRFAAGETLTDSAAVNASTWLERREALLFLEREERLGRDIPFDSVLAAAAYREGAFRLIAHVFRRVGPETSPSEVELQRRTAQRILDGLVAGGSWDAAVAESEDPESRAASGLLGLVGRGDLEPALDRVAFGLAPGQASAVVRGAEGFHILYRPRFEDVADLYAVRLRERRLAEADSASSVGITERRGVALSDGATARVRGLARDPQRGLSSHEQLATWDDGALLEQTVARYVLALPEPSRAEMADAREEALAAFLADLAVREVRLRDAARRGLALDEQALAELGRRHAEDVNRWREVLGLDGGSSPRLSLDRYMEQVVARRVDVPPLPPLLEAHLLEGVTWDVAEAGVDDALARASVMIGAASGVSDGPPGGDR